MNKLRVFEAFAGYGSQSIALRNIGIPYEVVAISEIDKYAIKAYESIHGEVNNLGDISKIKVEDIPEHDLFTYSFPCQDISVAGNMKGIEKGQTRSGLLYECEKVIEYCKPKYLLMENVKNLVGKKFINQFNSWLEYLESLGYTNYWKVLNAKDFGVPQNRERVFVVSILGEHEPYEFPKGFKLEKNIKSMLEDNVEDKYYLSDETIRKFVPNKNFTTAAIRGRYNEYGKIEQRLEQREDNITNTITTVQKDNVIVENVVKLGNIYPSGGQNGNIYNTEGISPTISAGTGINGSGIGSNNSPKIMDVGFIKKSENGTKHQSNTVLDEDYLMRTLTACDYKSPQLVTIKGKAITHKTICEQRCDEGLRFFKDDVCGTIRTINSGGDKRVVETEPNFRIRKLTSKECLRLMGLNDEDIQRIIDSGVSVTQQYKMAGNSIVVQVLEHIFEELFKKYK